ncbi:MAG TPA: glucodextranase DOMON-like domain-containing protein, partial [Usitatibacteraceae bacterium]|nr:glucodextranase DOMON-like domain-containing protein [Usitatibacteraceae bacterium]
RILKSNDAGAGALVYDMKLGHERLVIALNTADTETLAANIETGLPAGTRLEEVFTLHQAGGPVHIGAGGRLALRLAPRAGHVWKIGSAGAIAAEDRALAIETLRQHAARGRLGVAGQARGIGAFKLVLDGQQARAVEVTPDAAGRWQAEIDIASLVDARYRHEVVAWHDQSPAPPVVSASRHFRATPAWQPAAVYADPAGDDAGPDGRYHYPKDPTWGTNRQMDLRKVRAWRAAGSLKIELTAHHVTQTWRPSNGFDHVAFTVFIELPGKPGGARVMPLQNRELPGDLRWHVRLRANGWTNALFASAGADARSEGTPITPGATIAADARRNSVTFTLPADALGNLPDLKGARIYVTTWDYDGGYRALQPEPSGFAIGGGDGARDPLIMDDTPVLVLK